MRACYGTSACCPSAGSPDGVTTDVLSQRPDICNDILNDQTHQGGANGRNVKPSKAALGNGRSTDHDVSPILFTAEAAEPGGPFGAAQLSVTAGASTDEQEALGLGDEVPQPYRAHRASHPWAELVLRWTSHRAGLSLCARREAFLVLLSRLGRRRARQLHLRFIAAKRAAHVPPQDVLGPQETLQASPGSDC